MSATQSFDDFVKSKVKSKKPRGRLRVHNYAVEDNLQYCKELCDRLVVAGVITADEAIGSTSLGTSLQ